MSRRGDVVMVPCLPPNRVTSACPSADERFRTIVVPTRGNNRRPLPLQFRGDVSGGGDAALSFTGERGHCREHFRPDSGAGSRHRDRDW
jgi:hypothetical protein